MLPLRTQLAITMLAAACVTTPVRAQATALPLRMQSLQPRVDSLIMRMGEREFGWQRFTTEPLPDGFLFTEETVTPAAGQRTRIEVDRAGRVRRVQQQGLGANAAFFTEIVYADGRVRGRNATAGPTPAQVDTVDIDQIVPQDVVDDNMLLQLLPALPWTDDATWTFSYFSAGKRTLTTRTLRVTGAEPITVPAGTFDTWRAEMTLDDGNVVTFNVSRTAPHRLVRIGISAAPIEFVLVK